MLNSDIAVRSSVPYHTPLLRLFSVLIILSLVMLPVGASAAPAENKSGFRTSQPSMLTAVMAGVVVTLVGIVLVIL